MHGGMANFIGGVHMQTDLSMMPSFTGTAIIIRQESSDGATTTTAKVVGYGSYLGRTVSVELPLDIPDETLISNLLDARTKENLMLRVLNAAHEAMGVATRNKEYEEVKN